jgi:hypothetical protein
MKNNYFEQWKARMEAYGMLDSVESITDAPLEMYWRFATVCNHYKKFTADTLDISLGNFVFREVEGALPPGSAHILPYPGPGDAPFPVPDMPTPGPLPDPFPPYMPTETYFYRQVVQAEGGPAEAKAGIPTTEEELQAFISGLWGFPDLNGFLAIANTVAVKQGRSTLTAFDFFDQIAMGDWETMYGKIKLLIAGDYAHSMPYLDAQLAEIEGASWESYGAAIGGGIGGVVGAIVGAGGAAAVSGGTGSALGGVYGGGAGATAGGCAGAYIGGCIDEWTGG